MNEMTLVEMYGLVWLGITLGITILVGIGAAWALGIATYNRVLCIITARPRWRFMHQKRRVSRLLHAINYTAEKRGFTSSMTLADAATQLHIELQSYNQAK